MPVSAINSTTSAQAAQQTAAQIAALQEASSKPATGSTKSNTELDRDAFLKLLVAQLKNQDPDKPMDASAMISQSAQLSVVEKLNGISTTLTNMGLTNSMSLAGSVIGKSVSFKDADGAVQTEVVTSAKFVDGAMVLSAGPWDVAMSAVTAIGTTPAATSPATGTTTPSTGATTPSNSATTPPAGTPSTGATPPPAGTNIPATGTTIPPSATTPPTGTASTTTPPAGATTPTTTDPTTTPTSPTASSQETAQ